jgi:hypothetical protein
VFGGRLPNTLAVYSKGKIKGIARKLPKESAELLLAEINAHSKWVSPATSTDERVVLDTQSNSRPLG